MRESTIASILIQLQEPYEGIKIDLCREGEEVLLLHGSLIHIEHHQLGNLRSISRVSYISGIDRIASE